MASCKNGLYCSFSNEIIVREDTSASSASCCGVKFLLKLDLLMILINNLPL